MVSQFKFCSARSEAARPAAVGPPPWVWAALLAVVGLVRFAGAAEPATGVIVGHVVNLASGNGLNRARVAIQGTTLETVTDEVGEFRLRDVPVGNVRVTVAFLGMESEVATTHVLADRSVRMDFSLKLTGQAPARNGIVRMEAYTVAERELSGQAIALQERRSAPNIKHVISLEEFGDMGEGNVGEFLKFVPGVSMSYNPQTPQSAGIRGMPATGTIVMANGSEMASSQDGTRTFDLGLSASGNVDRVEVSKVPTPEMPANAIGGTINIISKTGFSRSKPLLSYNAFLTNNALNGPGDINPSLRRQAGPDPKTSVPYSQPAFNLSYIHPLNRRLAFTAALSRAPRYSDFQYLFSVWDRVRGLETQNRPGTLILTEQRDLAAISVDWKPAERHLVQAGFQGSNQTVFTRQFHLTTTVGANATGGPTFSQGSPAAVGNISQVFNTWTGQYKTLRHSTLNYRFDGARWKVDANAAYSLGGLRRKDTEDGFFNNITTSLTGLVVRYEGIDAIGRQRSAAISATNVAGRAVDIFDGNNYSVTAVSASPLRVDDEIVRVGFNARRDLSLPFPASFKFGGVVNRQTKDSRGGAFGMQFSPPGGAAAQVARNYDLIADGYSARTHFTDAAGQAVNVKWLSPYKLHQLSLAHPEYFVLGVAQQAAQYTSQVNTSKRLEETIPAAYVRGDVRLFQNRLWLVGGVRFEQTRDVGLGPRNDIGAIYQRESGGAFRRDAAGRLIPITNDALARARLQLTERGSRAKRVYDGTFPSFNSSFELTPHLLVRAAYAKTIGRPTLSEIISGITVTDPDSPAATRTITAINAGLSPWTANNYDLTVELYDQKGATASVSLFRKDLSNFFGTVRTPATPALLAEFGLTDDYLAYDVLTKRNFGHATIDGVEVGYRQSLAAFLPGWGKGIQAYANVTSLALGGQNADDFANFSPRDISWGLSFARPRFIAKINVIQSKWIRGSPVAASATVPVGSYTYTAPQTRIDLSAEYRFTKWLSVYGSIRNLTHSVKRTGTRGPGVPAYAQLDYFQYTGSLFTLGVKGDY
ncbi:MAG: TonB-dependent receptor [Opitutus sp.]|nr:TonB-dependent receptor [Opitutus sp.]